MASVSAWCLVDAGGRIVHANSAGYAIISAGDILRSAGGRLVAHESAGLKDIA